MGNEVKYLYVDGYNIINNWNSLKEIKDKISLLSARDELISSKIGRASCRERV